MEKELEELKVKVDTLTAELNLIKAELEKVKKGETVTGIYLDGCQDIVADFIKDEKGNN